MIQEAYCSFETCKRLKEKRFDVPCIAHWFVGKANNFSICSYPQNWNRIKSRFEWVSMPTLQMACRWLREVHGLFILIGNDDLDWNWQIFDIKNRDKNLDPICKSESYGGIDSYEEAVEAAIKYCLENLITG